MKIRRYYGHDCDSVNGFNNGYYIDDASITVKDEEEAMDKCIEFLSQEWGPLPEETEIRFDDYSVELITGYYDKDGNEIDEDDFDGEQHSYTYVYVSFEEA